jgi:hypothetical protein
LIRKVSEKRPDVGGKFLIFTPPMSRELHVFCGGRIAVGRGASMMGATVEDGWFALVALCELGEVSNGATSSSLAVPFISVLGLELGFVIGMADLVTVREAMALARAR